MGDELCLEEQYEELMKYCKAIEDRNVQLNIELAAMQEEWGKMVECAAANGRRADIAEAKLSTMEGFKGTSWK